MMVEKKHQQMNVSIDSSEHDHDVCGKTLEAPNNKVEPTVVLLQQETSCSKGGSGGTTITAFHQCLYFDPMASLGSVEDVDRLFRAASWITVVAWFGLTAAVYWTVASSELFRNNERECLGADDIYNSIELMGNNESRERNVAQTGFWILLVCTALQIVPLCFPRGELSGVVVAALTILMISLATNALLAWGPALVITDPFSRARVFYWRWCEWVVLAGLMTLMAGTYRWNILTS